MKRLTLALAAFTVLALNVAPAEAGHRRPYHGHRVSAHRYHGNPYAYQSRGNGYGYSAHGLSRYGTYYDQSYGYFSRYPTYDVYSYPSYGYGGYFGGRYGGGAFAGSPNDGNHWYWLSQQAGQGQIPWSSVNEQMYGRR